MEVRRLCRIEINCIPCTADSRRTSSLTPNRTQEARMPVAGAPGKHLYKMARRLKHHFQCLGIATLSLEFLITLQVDDFTSGWLQNAFDPALQQCATEVSCKLCTPCQIFPPLPPTSSSSAVDNSPRVLLPSSKGHIVEINLTK